MMNDWEAWWPITILYNDTSCQREEGNKTLIINSRARKDVLMYNEQNYTSC